DERITTRAVTCARFATPPAPACSRSAIATSRAARDAQRLATRCPLAHRRPQQRPLLRCDVAPRELAATAWQLCARLPRGLGRLPPDARGHTRGDRESARGPAR